MKTSLGSLEETGIQICRCCILKIKGQVSGVESRQR